MVDRNTIPELQHWDRTVDELERAITFNEHEDIHRLITTLFRSYMDFALDEDLISPVSVEELAEEVYALIRKVEQ